MKKIIEKLLAHHPVILPTDSVPGLAALADLSGYQELVGLKNRRGEKRFVWAFCDLDMLKKYIEVDDKAWKLITHFLPGKVTFIVKAAKSIDSRLLADDQTIGIRIPDCPFALEVISLVGQPLLLTSVNHSDQKPLVSIDEIKKEFGQKINCYAIDEFSYNQPTTIYSIVEKRIIRSGLLDEQIQKFIKEEL